MQQSMQGMQLDRHYDPHITGASNYVLNLKQRQNNPENS